jgi:acyl carrier protein
MRTERDIQSLLTDILEELFEVEREAVVAEARLYDDLDIDSIDAVDLVARLTEITGIRVQPEQFKSVETVGDVVATVQALVGGR